MRSDKANGLKDGDPTKEWDEATRRRVFDTSKGVSNTSDIVKARISKPIYIPQSPRKKGLAIDCKDCPNECRSEKKFCPPENVKQ